eukprot:8716808-Pyramimonas_sp.AAC.1
MVNAPRYRVEQTCRCGKSGRNTSLGRRVAGRQGGTGAAEYTVKEGTDANSEAFAAHCEEVHQCGVEVNKAFQ